MNALFNTAKRDFANGTHDWDLGSQAIKVMLVTSAYVFNADHEFVTSANAAELSGTGYTGGFGGSGRKALANRTVTANLTADRAELDADDVTWTAINAGTAAAVLVIREQTSDADSQLIAFIDSGFPVTTDGTDLKITWNAAGVLQLT